MMNSVGISTSLLRVIDRRHRGDRWITYGGMVPPAPRPLHAAAGNMCAHAPLFHLMLIVLLWAGKVQSRAPPAIKPGLHTSFAPGAQRFRNRMFPGSREMSVQRDCALYSMPWITEGSARKSVSVAHLTTGAPARGHKEADSTWLMRWLRAICRS